MAYRKLGRTNKHRRSMLANLTKEVIMHERIETTEFHLVYKCPADQEWAQQVKQQQPNGKFRAGGQLNLEELYADTEHVYAEVSFDDPGTCKENFTIRTMIAEPIEGGDNWAFVGCR